MSESAKRRDRDREESESAKARREMNVVRTGHEEVDVERGQICWLIAAATGVAFVIGHSVGMGAAISGLQPGGAIVSAPTVWLVALAETFLATGIAAAAVIVVTGRTRSR